MTPDLTPKLKAYIDARLIEIVRAAEEDVVFGKGTGVPMGLAEALHFDEAPDA